MFVSRVKESTLKFLIDGSAVRIAQRRLQAGELIEGQLLTPLTGYRRCEEVWAVDNGGFKKAMPDRWARILSRHWELRHQCLFAAVPDKIESHKETLTMWEDYHHLADGYKKAFVAQNGYDGHPSNAQALFIGGSNNFKDSLEVDQVVEEALSGGLHVHIGRVNTFKRFWHFHRLGAHTCDGSGISKYDHMLEKLYKLFKEAQC